MQVKYIASSNTATNGTALGTATQDVRVYKLLIGLPTDTSTVVFYEISNPIGGATTNIAWKLTQPTAAAGKEWVREVDFGPHGLPLNQGGNVVIDGTNNVSVIWDIADNSNI
jgi:hypothetical protein